jgi:Ca-activated chloride channel homolog
MLRKISALILCAGFYIALTMGLAAHPPSQTEQASLSLDVSLVNVFVTAQDSRGEYVTGLNSGDFKIFEDDVEKKISIFEKEDRIGSSVGLLMDNSGSMVDILPIMKTGVLDFAQKARRGDEFFVMTFGIRAQVIQDIRQPVTRLETAFKTIMASGTSVFFDAMLQGMSKVGRSDQQRKALIVFSDGNDNGSKSGFGDVSHAAQRSNVLLYFIPIGPKRMIDQPTVDSLAKLTGGRVLYLDKAESIRPVIESIRTELAKQYYLGYYVAKRPGLHRIRVEIPGQNLTIRSKTEYMVN